MAFPPSCRSAFGWGLWWVCLLAPQLTRAEPRLAYVKGRTIYTARAADGQQEREVCVGDRPCISHDGRWLAYTRNDGAPGPHSTRTIVVRELASGKEHALPTGTSKQVYGALWSPDDTWIAYNALGAENWQVAAAHPDGSAFHLLTDQLPDHERGYYLAGWNLHAGAVLAQNCQLAVQLDPGTGQAAWTRPVAQFISGQSASSETRFTISVDGRQIISCRETEGSEIPALAKMGDTSGYLALADFDLAAGTPPRQATPAKFAVSAPYVSTDGVSIFLGGFGAADVRLLHGGNDGMHIQERLYHYDLRSGKLTPLVEGGSQPSVSRD